MQKNIHLYLIRLNYTLISKNLMINMLFQFEAIVITAIITVVVLSIIMFIIGMYVMR